MTVSKGRISTGAATRRLRVVYIALAVLGFTTLGHPAAPQSVGAGRAAVLHLEGAIGPATADYVERAIEDAASGGAKAVILRLDTPGGLDISMREIVQAIIASPVPVLTYVSPGGARAASAGTFILYASHVAAMAPATNVGAATPVQLGGIGLPGGERGPTQTDDSGAKAAPKDGGGASEAKAVNDAVAYIRGLAELRGRNADWGELAVREAASLEAGQAQAAGVIDFVARDIPDLLMQADGRRASVAESIVTLQTRGLALEHIRPDWRHRLLTVVTNPNVALILMMIGVYGLIFEFMNPGALYPGVIGVICLLVGLYSVAVLPVNYAGLALVIVGIGLMVAEGFTPSFGILGLGGAAAFLFGGMILIDTDLPELAVSLPLLAILAAASLAFSLLLLRMALDSRRRAIVTGREQMIGATGVVQDWEGGSGHVFARSERWRAVSDAALARGDRVRTVAVKDLTLTVEPEENGERP